MRWIFFLILSYVMILIQTSAGRILTFDTHWFGTIGPDLLAPLAVFTALYVRRTTDVMIVACILGFALDLTTAGSSGSAAVIGPMVIAYALAARGLLGVREAFFRDRPLTQMLLTFLFCLFAHCLWVTLQSILGYDFATFSEYGRMLVQAVGISCYSGILGPILLSLFIKGRRWLIAAPAGRSRRRAR